MLHSRIQNLVDFSWILILEIYFLRIRRFEFAKNLRDSQFGNGISSELTEFLRITAILDVGLENVGHFCNFAKFPTTFYSNHVKYEGIHSRNAESLTII